MRRPVCLFVLVLCVAVWAALLIRPPQPVITEKAEGRYVTLCGTVEGKEYALRSPGNELYIRMTLKNAVMESRLPQEGAFEIHRDDKVLCLIEDEPAMQQEWAREGATGWPEPSDGKADPTSCRRQASRERPEPARGCPRYRTRW